MHPAPSKSNVEAPERRLRFSLRQRIALAVVSSVGYVVIRVLGATLRFAWSEEDGATPERIARPAIYSFWHQCIFPAAALFRGQGVGVMTSLSFDGEFIARVIEQLGFRAVRGSSSRGAVGVLLGMRREVEAGEAVAFTIDGPRGPRFVAKPGPVMLARKTGAPIMVFHLGVDRGKTFEKTWDHFLLPMPFARAVIFFAPPIYVPKDASVELMEAKHAEMQRELERVRDIAEAWFTLSESERQKYRAEFSS